MKKSLRERISPKKKRRVVFHEMEHFVFSERKICRMLSQPRLTQYYLPRVIDGKALLTKCIIELATKYGEVFTTLLKAKVLIEKWRKEYNQIRPHSSPNYQPPAPVKRLSKMWEY